MGRAKRNPSMLSHDEDGFRFALPILRSVQLRDTRAKLAKSCALVDRWLPKIRGKFSLTSLFRHSCYAAVSKRGGAVLECDRCGGRRVNKTLRGSTEGCEKS